MNGRRHADAELPITRPISSQERAPTAHSSSPPRTNGQKSSGTENLLDGRNCQMPCGGWLILCQKETTGGHSHQPVCREDVAAHEQLMTHSEVRVHPELVRLLVLPSAKAAPFEDDRGLYLYDSKISA